MPREPRRPLGDRLADAVPVGDRVLSMDGGVEAQPPRRQRSKCRADVEITTEAERAYVAFRAQWKQTLEAIAACKRAAEQAREAGDLRELARQQAERERLTQFRSFLRLMQAEVEAGYTARFTVVEP